MIDLSKKFYQQIINIFLDPNYLKDLSIDASIMSSFIKEPSFYENIVHMIKNHEYSCYHTLKLCEPLLDTLCQNHAPKNWLFYIYQFVLHKSFPNAVEIELNPTLQTPCLIYLDLLKIVSDYQKCSQDDTFQSQYPLIFLTSKEIQDLEDPSEYQCFVKAFNENYIYEMMKLNSEVAGYNTIDHICGVHYLALFIARQLKLRHVPIDLGRISGSTAGHDIGKYGCQKHEQTRVPYLHYYYTDQWFLNYPMPYIRHIAIHHSVWDLELDNLSLESLILIYSDFRVKNKIDPSGNWNMHIYTLSDSFHVILEKLDHLDEHKKKRYQKVYNKLKDFEKYMLSLNIDINIQPKKTLPYPMSAPNDFYYPLMQGIQIIDHLKYISIDHNIRLMYLLRNEYSLDTIFEAARSEQNSTNLRAYLQIFEEYSTYLTPKQKLITLRFLYDYLIYPKDDIRKRCSRLIGILISTFDESYGKELPKNVKLPTPDITSMDLIKKYIQDYIFPDHRMTPKHRKWIGYSLSSMIEALLDHTHSSSKKKQYLDEILNYYHKDFYQNHNFNMYLLQTLHHIPKNYIYMKFQVFLGFLKEMLHSKNTAVKISALESIYHLISPKAYDPSWYDAFFSILKDELYTYDYPSEGYIKDQIKAILKDHIPTIVYDTSSLTLEKAKISPIFLSNLKVATHPVIKKIQIEILLKQAFNHTMLQGLQTALHFCNLLKVSSSDTIRTCAGKAILDIAPYLSFEQRNEVAVELLNSLEFDGYQFTEYIPPFLGQLILTLQPVELDELLDELIEKFKHSNWTLNILLLKTIGVSIAHYPRYSHLFSQDSNLYQMRLHKMIGILLSGLVHHHEPIKQAAMVTIGKEIFGCTSLDLNLKNTIFRLMGKKILTLLTPSKKETLLFLANCASLHHIYRFLSEYSFVYDDQDMPSYSKIAFFPGTFDPFSLAHKKIAKTVRDLGFEVYLGIDEFSWSKHTLPHLLRKRIAHMSIADELNIYIYPENFPTHLQNKHDLLQLQNNFKNATVSIVVGSDVILHAKSYQQTPSEGSIHHFPHIIIEKSVQDDFCRNHILKTIYGSVQILSLPTPYEDISSSQIRNDIDKNRDLSALVDPLAQKYIYENGFYKREPQYKNIAKGRDLSIQIIKHLDVDLIYEIIKHSLNPKKIHHQLVEFFKKDSPRLLILRDEYTEELLGFCAIHWARLNNLFNDLKDSHLSEYIRNHSHGRIIILDALWVFREMDQAELEQILLTETLALCLSKDYEYAVFFNMLDNLSSSLEEILELQGFKKLSFCAKSSAWVVKMNAPCTLNFDIEGLIKRPFLQSQKVQLAISKCRKRLQKSLTQLYPENLILGFNKKMLHHNLIRKICQENHVPTKVHTNLLGSNICVPFGNMLNQSLIPNTITKSLHTEKLFLPDMKDFFIGPFPLYPDLSIQMKILKSFNKPIILVDDILHKGYRNNVIHPLLCQADIHVQKTIVGILSAKGKELMDQQNRKVDCAYYIPKLKAWFNENLLYPFFGGHTIWRGHTPKRNLVPSINLILPYTSPTFIHNASKSSQFQLSKVCIHNAMDILTVIENEYHKVNEKKLTLGSLGEVFISPRCPDHGKNMHYDLNIQPSHYLKNDLDQLDRLQNIILHE